MKHIIIATTAINRPILHNDNMGEWIDWFLELKNSDTNLKWFLNIDIVDKLQCTYEQTKTNFENLIMNRVDTTFLSNPTGKGNFLDACKRLSSNIVKYVDSLKLSQKEQSKIKVIWLEDDWKLSNVTKISCKEVVQNYSTDNSHTNLSFNRNNYIWALAPSIISYRLWKNLFYAAWSAETKPIDPEHCVGLYYRKKYGNPDLLCNVTVINKSVKDKYLGERHMLFPESYYTYHNDNFQINNNDRYIFKDCLTSYLGDKMVFIRITSSFCVDGCLYGRKFLEKYNIEKTHASDVNQFYGVTSDKPVACQKRTDEAQKANHKSCLLDNQTVGEQAKPSSTSGCGSAVKDFLTTLSPLGRGSEGGDFSGTKVKEAVKKELEIPVNVTEVADTPKKEESIEIIEPPKLIFLISSPDDGLENQETTVIEVPVEEEKDETSVSLEEKTGEKVFPKVAVELILEEKQEATESAELATEEKGETLVDLEDKIEAVNIPLDIVMEAPLVFVEEVLDL
jgi:hypothetical protein